MPELVVYSVNRKSRRSSILRDFLAVSTEFVVRLFFRLVLFQDNYFHIRIFIFY